MYLAQRVGTTNQAGWPAQVTTAPIERAMRRQSSPNGAAIEANDDAPNRRLEPRYQFQQAQLLGADLGIFGSAPSGLEAKLLHQHIGGSPHLQPQLVGQETRATGAVGLKAERQFLESVFHIAPGAVNVLVDMPQRGLEEVLRLVTTKRERLSAASRLGRSASP